MFVVMGGRTAFAVLYPAMVADLGWSVAEVTGAFSAGLLIYGPAALGVGVMVDRVGCRATLLLGCACLIVGMIIVALSAQLWQFYVAFVLVTGIGSAATGFITVIKLLSMRSRHRFAAAFGVVSTGNGIGALVMSPAVQVIIDLAGWRAGALAVAALTGVGLLPLVIAVAPGREEDGHTPRGAALPSRPSLLGWTFILFFLSNFAMGYQLLLPTHQVAHLIEVGFSPIVAASVAGAWGALIAVGGIAGGWAWERWGAGRQIAIGTFLFVVGTPALVVGHAGAAWLLVPYVLASGIGRGMIGVALGAAQTRAFAGPRLGWVTGLGDLGYGGGAFLGPWLTAVIHDADGGFGPGLATSVAAGVAVPVTILLGARAAARREVART